LVLTDGVGSVSMTWVGLLGRRRKRGGYRRVGGGGSPGPVPICGEIWHGIFWVAFIKGHALTDESWAAGGRTWVRRPIAT
jgi:hypothetical protein